MKHCLCCVAAGAAIGLAAALISGCLFVMGIHPDINAEL